MADQEGLIKNFIAVTGVDRERAVFFLQSAAWSMDVRDDFFLKVSKFERHCVETAMSGQCYSQPWYFSPLRRVEQWLDFWRF